MLHKSNNYTHTHAQIEIDREGERRKIPALLSVLDYVSL